jgi:acyl-CoA reductase-like NAD-dependent aldehyde dehydrogenase
MIAMAIERGLLIGGKDVPGRSGRTTPDYNPYTGAVYATVAAAQKEDVTAAVDVARAEFPSWAAAAPFDRRAIFGRAAELLEARRDRLAEVMAAEVGSVTANAYFNVELAVNLLRELAASITAPRGSVLASQQPGVLGLAVREPLGVVASFSPWNAPVVLGVRAAAAPMAAGNTVVLKPSENAPLSAGLLVADLFRDAGLPDGVLNVVTNDPGDAAAVTGALVGNESVRAVSFTGSTRVGRIIGSRAAACLKPAVLELGGKNSIIVCDDADIDYAVSATVYGAFANSGQVCMAADRILVQRSRAPEFIDKFATIVRDLPAGSPDDPDTAIGPMISYAAAQRVSGLIADAVGRGARVLVGGGAPVGAVLAATVLTDVPATAELYYAESFGPVCVIDTFDTDDEAIAKANDTEQGLAAGIFTENGTRGLGIAQRLETGLVHVNDQSVADEPQAPFGGIKASGYGRFGGRWAIETFSNTRWITLATQHTRYR